MFNSTKSPLFSKRHLKHQLLSEEVLLCRSCAGDNSPSAARPAIVPFKRQIKSKGPHM